MIVFDQVTKQFPLGNTALQDISFEIEDNDFVFLVGPSGAGKTTILRLIMHEYAPSSGSIMVNDLDISANNFRKLEKLRKNLGVIFQDFKILTDKNVFENIALSLRVLNMSTGYIKNEVNEVLELVGIPDKKFLFPAQLSAGELQRVAIARAIIGDRNIILADEPTGNLDPKTSWEIMRIFKKLEKKKTIIIATHNSDIVNSMKKRVLIMQSGELKKDTRKGGYDL
ncbi:ATP-binding cassette domain-containing protein [Candidatus Roizmanbacteria bacterium]|nr:ATP-binding cassette domain-containing protein [Candidatus Roizmanbacteria bacterium]